MCKNYTNCAIFNQSFRKLNDFFLKEKISVQMVVCVYHTSQSGRKRSISEHSLNVQNVASKTQIYFLIPEPFIKQLKWGPINYNYSYEIVILEVFAQVDRYRWVLFTIDANYWDRMQACWITGHFTLYHKTFRKSWF